MVNVPTEQTYIFGAGDADEAPSKLVRRDPVKRNRYWFKYPSDWQNSHQRERIVGVRSCFIRNTARTYVTGFLFRKKVRNNPTKVSCMSFVFSFLTNDTYNIYDLWDELSERFKTGIANNKDKWIAEGTPIITEEDLQIIYIMYESMYVCDLVTVSRDSYLCDYYLTPDPMMLTNYNFPDDFNQYPEGDERNFRTKCKIGIPWTGNPVILKSNLCYNISMNYLGFSDTHYVPIKYYKINTNDPEFWIETWFNRNHKLPAIFPSDNKDTIILEMVILHNATELYN